MKKGLTTLLVILLALGAVLVSCKAEIGTQADELVSASFELESSKALSATLEPFNPGDYYWKYAARKNVSDTSGLTSGKTTSYDATGAEWVKVVSGAPVTGLAGYIVPNFSQGIWDFKLFAYKLEGTQYKLVYQGEATAVTLVKGGTNLVHVVVSPSPTGNGTLVIGATSLAPKTTSDIPTVSRSLKVEDLNGQQYYPTSGTTYDLAAGAYKVTVSYMASGILYADGMVIATVYPNMTTTVTGSVDELVTYAQFEAEQNPDIITRTAGVDNITSTTTGDDDGNLTLTEDSEIADKRVTATVPAAAAVAMLPDPDATMSLMLNVDTKDSTSTSVTYEISMTKVVTLDSEVTTSDVTDLGVDAQQKKYYATATVKLSTGLTGVSVTHNGNAMVESTDVEEDEGNGIYSYDATTGILTIVTNTFSPFAVTYDGQTAGVAEVNGVKYATLKAAVEAANAGDTVKLLSDADGAGMSISKNLTIDLNGKTYTGTMDPAGSTGTQTQLFQLLSGTITIKNGKLASTAGSGIKMLVQNYSNLTLKDVVLDGSNLGEGQYTLSNNRGETSITGATSIIAPPKGIAFDVCSGWGGYTSCTVNLNTTGTISGNIEVSDWKDGTVGVYLNVDAAVFSGDIVVPEWTDKIHINKVCYNADSHVWYDDLQAAINAATASDTIVMVQDVSLNSVLLVGKSVTIQGRGHEIKNSANRIVRITAAKCDVKIYDWTMISTCTLGTDERGISFDNASSGSKLLLDGCKVSAEFYVINAIPGANNLEVTIKNGTIAAGWAAINCYSNNSTWTIEDSVLKGLNDKGESSWNNFNTITFDGNTLNGAQPGQYGTGNTITISKSTVYASSENSNIQHWIGLQYGASNNTVTVDSDTDILDLDSNDVSNCWLVASNTTGNSISVGGVVVKKTTWIPSFDNLLIKDGVPSGSITLTDGEDSTNVVIVSLADCASKPWAQGVDYTVFFADKRYYRNYFDLDVSEAYEEGYCLYIL